jgi:hypothetical protein
MHVLRRFEHLLVSTYQIFAECWRFRAFTGELRSSRSRQAGALMIMNVYQREIPMPKTFPIYCRRFPAFCEINSSSSARYRRPLCQVASSSAAVPLLCDSQRPNEVLPLSTSTAFNTYAAHILPQPSIPCKHSLHIRFDSIPDSRRVTLCPSTYAQARTTGQCGTRQHG